MLKKDDPQIIANKISKNKSKVLASLISSWDCIYVISAYQVYIFSYTLKTFVIYVQCEFKNNYIYLKRQNEFKKRSKTYER